MSTELAGANLQARYARFRQHQSNDNTSIELPAEINELITGSKFWVDAKTNRYKKLIREGYLDKLLQLVREAQTKDHPDHWFAAACSKQKWETQTLPYLAKLQEVATKAAEVARRLGTRANNFVYKQIWKGVNVVRWAVAAQEVSHDKPGQSKGKCFTWLCVNEHRFAF